MALLRAHQGLECCRLSLKKAFTGPRERLLRTTMVTQISSRSNQKKSSTFLTSWSDKRKTTRCDRRWRLRSRECRCQCRTGTRTSGPTGRRRTKTSLTMTRRKDRELELEHPSDHHFLYSCSFISRRVTLGVQPRAN